nr:hypothetical protein [Tanacetum cinerariifolium]
MKEQELNQLVKLIKKKDTQEYVLFNLLGSNASNVNVSIFIMLVKGFILAHVIAKNIIVKGAGFKVIEDRRILFSIKTKFFTFSSRNIPSPQPINPFLDDPLDAPARPSNPLPLLCYLSLDITLSLSPITSLDHMFKTLSPPPPPPPPPHPPPPPLQPSLMGHPIFFNILDYHGTHCFCCFHNRVCYKKKTRSPRVFYSLS